MRALALARIRRVRRDLNHYRDGLQVDVNILLALQHPFAVAARSAGITDCTRSHAAWTLHSMPSLSMPPLISVYIFGMT